MYCLSVRQPWVNLIRLGQKTIETRRQRFGRLLDDWVAVHASRTFRQAERNVMDSEPFQSTLARFAISTRTAIHADNPRGTIVGVAHVIGIEKAEDVSGITDKERAFGDYGPKRYAYHLGRFFQVNDWYLFERGRLGIWELDPALRRRVLVALQHHEDLPKELTSPDLVDEALRRLVARQQESERVDDLLDAVTYRRKRLRDNRSPIDRLIDQAVQR